MANKKFVAKNGIAVGSGHTTTDIIDQDGHITANTVTISGTLLNATAFAGTANNASYLEGSNGSYYTGYADNKAANAYSNAISYADTAAGTAYSNAASYADNKAANAYSNAIAYSANATNISSGTLTANVLPTSGVTANTYGNSSSIPVITVDATGRITSATTNAVAGVTGFTYTPSNATFIITTGAGSTFPASISSANDSVAGIVKVLDSVSNTDIYIAASANSVKTAYDNAATAYSNAATYADNKAANAYSNATSYASSIAGTAYSNATTFASSAAATAYTNATSYADTVAGTAYTNATSYAATIAGTAYTNATSYAATIAGTAYSNATTFASSAAATAYSNAVSAASSSAATAYSNATTFAANASNISSGTLAEARLPFRMDQNVRTNDSVSFGNMTITGNLTVTGTTVTVNANNLSVQDNMIYLNSNSSITNPDLGIAGNYNDGTYRHAGFFRDASDGVWKIFDQYLPEPDASPYIDTANASFRIADFQANVVTAASFSGNGASVTSVNAATVGGNTAGTLRSYSDSTAATAYSNATSYAATIAGTAYTNATSFASSAAATAYSNAVSAASSSAATAYSNAVSYAASIAGTAYSNATSYAATIAGTAYSNATSYAATIAGTAYSNAVSYFTTNYTASDVLTKIKTVDGSGSGLDADLLDGINSIGLYNNMGQSHSTRTAFDASTPSYDFGYRFVQGNANGPGTGGDQFYSWYIGLGEGYPATGAGSYGAMFAVDRNTTTPYLSVRWNESNSFSAWYKIRAGYADSSGGISGYSGTYWTSANDGSGSGLDADTVDGLQASAFAQLSGNNSFDSGTLFIDSVNNRVGVGTTTPRYAFQVNKTSIATPAMAIGGAFYGGPRFQLYDLDADSNAWMGFGVDMSGGAYEHNIYFPDTGSYGRLSFGTYNGTTYTERMALSRTGVFTVGGNTVWNAGNDGSGSGLDADLLDGLNESTFFRRTADSWNTDSSGQARFYFSPSSTMYLRTGANFVFRNSSDTGVVTIDGSGNLRTTTSGDNYASYSLHVGGTGFASSDFRAPIFYDSANTSFYVDPAGTSYINTLQTNGGYPVKPYVFNVYTLPNTGGTSGWIFLGTFYGGQDGQHLYIKVTHGTGYNANVDQNGDTHIHFKTSNGSSNSSGFYGDGYVWRVGQNQPTVRVVQVSTSEYQVHMNFGAFTGGSHYYISSNATWVNNGTNNGSTAPSGTYIDLPTIYSTDSQGNFTATTSSRAPIFYDSANTSYYVDPGSGSSLKYLRVDGDWNTSPFGSGHANFTVTGTYASMYQTATNGSLGYMLHHIASDGSYYMYGGRGAVNGSDWNWGLRVLPSQDGNHVEFRTSARAPIFYDTANTSCYLDLAENAAAYGSVIRSGVLFGPNYTWGAYLLVGGNGKYSYGENSGDVASVVTTNGNLHLDSGSGKSTYINYYDGDNVYFGNGGQGIVAQVAGDGSFRSPVYYDYANTSFYLDPGSTSTSLNIAGGITTTAAGGSILLKHAVSEVDAWIFQENASNWGLYWKNAPSGHHTFGGYTSVGAELVGLSAVNASGNGVATTNFVGATSAVAQWMISNYTGYIWSASTIYAAGSMSVGGNTVWHAGNDGAGSGLDADTLDGVDSSGFVNTTNNSGLNSDSRNTRGVTRLYRRDDNSDYSVQTYWTGSYWRLYGYSGDSGHADTHVGYADSAGSASSASSAGSVSGLTLTSSSNGINPDSVTQNQLGYNTSVSLFGQTDGGLYSSAYSSSWIHQIYGDFRTGQIAIRGKNSGTWQSWRVVLDSSNYTSYTGGLGSVNTWTNTNYFRSNRNTTSSDPPLQAYSSDSGGAIMAFHRGGYYAVNFGLDSDNVMRIGGWSASTNRWQLDMSGNMTVAGNITASSDIRLKKDIQVIENAIEKVKQIRGVTFTRIDKGNEGAKQAGVIAQEVEKVLPEVVMEDNEGIKNVAYGNMVGLLIEAIKEQQKQIEELKAALLNK